MSVGAGLIPFVAALIFGTQIDLDVPPLSLAIHLFLVSALTWFVGAREGLPLSPVAATLSVLVWLARANTALFEHTEVTAYGSMTVLPVAQFAVWLLRRRAGDVNLYRALLILLVGASPLTLAARNAYSLGDYGITLLFFAAHAVLLLISAIIESRGLPLLLAQAVMLTSVGGAYWIGPANSVKWVGATVIASGLSFFVLPKLSPRLRADRLGWVSSTLALPFHFLLLYMLLSDTWSRELLGVIALAGGALSLGMLLLLRDTSETAGQPLRQLRATFGAGAIGLSTAALPILLRNEWLTISFALEVLGLCWLYRHLRVRGLLVFAGLLAVTVTVRLTLNPELWDYHERTGTPILNFYLYAFGVPIAAFYAAARLLREDDGARKVFIPSGLGFLGTVLFFFLLNVEIADYFSTGNVLSFRLSGGGLAEDMTYSLGWGAFGIGLLLAGLLLRNRAARIGALCVLLLTIGKVFLHDLWALGALYRVGSIVGLALALLGVSYLIQRFISPQATK
ncbi:MAG: DUF2339 domain-containing protein [Polyangiaceae bacterium]